MLRETSESVLKSFIVETAPVDLMPTAIQLFLDSVDAGVWDNTILLHHEAVDHVISAAPIDHTTQRVKNMKFGNLGWIGVGYPEYSEKFQHEKYTLGFAGLGPTFYINTMDNSEPHGPGGQSHHVLSSDAEPCFAKVIEGFDVVDDLMRLGVHQKKVGSDADHSWADDEHTWTHLVSAKIVNKHQTIKLPTIFLN
jgi:cyclophilin family peptidyl-prolyl cis-trans isomerase